MRFATSCATMMVSVLACFNVAQGQSRSIHDFISDDFVAGVVFHPQDLWQSSLSQSIVKAIDPVVQFDVEIKRLTRRLNIDPREVLEVAILIDAATLHQIYRITPQELGEKVDPAFQRSMHLKRIGLAYHNYIDTFRVFPPDGPGIAIKGQLSWRVHILPFVEQEALYDQFHLDEDWDSEHNLALVEKMPDIFKCPGIDKAGQTSLHRFTKQMCVDLNPDRTPSPLKIRDILDGTAYTIMVVIAGPDKAEPWTRPGGLEWQEGAAKLSLGDVGDDFQTVFCDGSARTIGANINPETFRRLVHRDDRQAIEESFPNSAVDRDGRPPGGPTIVLRTTSNVDRSQLNNFIASRNRPPAQSKINGASVSTNRGRSVAVIDPQTFVIASEHLMPKLLADKSARQSVVANRLKTHSSNHDLFALVDLRALKLLRAKLESAKRPIEAVAGSVEVAEANVNISQPGDFVEARIVATDKEAADRMKTFIVGVTQMQKFGLMQSARNPDAKVDGRLYEPVISVIDNLEIKQEGKIVSLRLPKPANMPALMAQLQPALTVARDLTQKNREQAGAVLRKNNLKRIALAFHNYYDTYRWLPRYDGSGDARQLGLSWRVHLLPFLDQSALYEQFNFDEAWDSERNRKLIESMPDVFAVEGIDTPGHTSIHVFTGVETPFVPGKGRIGFRDITDGTANTILAVEAGKTTAAIWTKPGGLGFSGSNGMELLGDIGATFLVAMVDGSVLEIDKNAVAKVLPLMIKRKDHTPFRIPRR